MNKYSNSFQDNIIISGTSDADSIYNAGNSVTIEAGDGNDKISNKGGVAHYASLSSEFGYYVKIDAGAGDDSISNFMGNYVSIDGDTENDDIHNKYGHYSTINAGAGNDEVYNDCGRFVLINAGDGDDFIKNFEYSNDVTINGGKGNDTIKNGGANCTIEGGAGDDSIYNVANHATIHTSEGNDTIYNYGAYVTIDAGASNDIIWNNGYYNLIYTGEGNDSINTGGYYGYYATIRTGLGNDTITGATNTGTVIKIVAGDINSATLDGEDVVIKIGENSTRLTGVKDKEVTLVSAQGETIKFTNSYIGVQETDTQSGGGEEIKIDSATTLEVMNLFAGLSAAEKATALQENLNSVQEVQTLLEGAKNVEIVDEDTGKTIYTDVNNLLSMFGDIFDKWTENLRDKNFHIIYKVHHKRDSNGNFVRDPTSGQPIKEFTLDANGNKIPIEDNNDAREIISNGFGAILNINATLESIEKIVLGRRNGTLEGSEFAAEVTNLGANVANLVSNLTSLGGLEEAGIVSSLAGSALSAVGSIISLTDGVEPDEIVDTVTNCLEFATTLVTKFSSEPFLEATKFGDLIKNNTIAQTLSANALKINLITAVALGVYKGGVQYFESAEKYAIDGLESSLAVKNKWIDTFGTAIKTFGNVVTLGLDDAIFGTVFSSAAGWTYGIQYLWTLATGGDTSQVKLNTTGGKNYMEFIGDWMKLVLFDQITGTKNDDFIPNDENFKKIVSGEGNDHISNFGSNVQIYSGVGDDSIFCHAGTQSNYIDGGNDEDNLFFYGSSNEVHGGYGNDKITAYNDGKNPTSGNIIYGEGGDDLIVINDGGLTTRKSNNTISGGAGDDIIVIENTNIPVVLQYSKGDGNDIVYGFNANDSIKIHKSDYTVSADGANTKIQVGDGSITLIDYKGKKPKIIKTNEEILPLGITADKKSTTLTVGNKFRGGNVFLEDYAETFTKINASGLAKTQPVEIYGNAANNSLKGGKGADTISGGAGNDTLIGGNGADLFIYSGGNDLITDYKAGEDKIKIGAITSSTVKGSDVILTTQNGTLTLKGVKDKAVTFVNDSGLTSDRIFFGGTSYAPLATGLKYDAKRITLTADKKFSGSEINLGEYLSSVTKINASAVRQGLNLVGNSAANSIKGGRGADTISGGSGNDTLIGGNGADLFIYSGGNDIITDYKAGEDKIKIGAITSSTVKGSNVILTTQNGTLTLKGVKDKAVTFIDDSGNSTDKIFFGGTSYAPLATSLKYDAKRITLTADKKFSGNKIDLGDYLSSVTKVNAAALSTGISIVGNSANNSLKGGKGADTLFGGSGNDTLIGGGGADLFIYSGGNDIITDYTAGQDKIKISGTISNTAYKNKDVIYTIGGGTLTIKNGKGKEITFDNTNARTAEIFVDDNFISDAPQLDSITENKYAVTQIQTQSETFAQEKPLLTFAKK